MNNYNSLSKQICMRYCRIMFCCLDPEPERNFPSLENGNIICKPSPCLLTYSISGQAICYMLKHLYCCQHCANVVSQRCRCGRNPLSVPPSNKDFKYFSFKVLLALVNKFTVLSLVKIGALCKRN